jgi:hypothetical protein
MSSCSFKKYSFATNIFQIDIVAVPKGLTSANRLNENFVHKVLYKHGFKLVLEDKRIIKKITKSISTLKGTDVSCDVEVWLSILIHYKNGETKYLSFTGYSNFSIIRFDGKCYEWNQELIELFYPYIPKYIMESLPDEIK